MQPVASVLLVIVTSVYMCWGYRTLVVFPFPGRSHAVLGAGLVRALLQNGHQVTYLSSFPLETSNSLLRQMNVSLSSNPLNTQNTVNLRDRFDKTHAGESQKEFIEIINKLNHDFVKNEEVSTFLEDPHEQFDVVILEWLISDFLNGLSAVFRCPYVWVSPLEPYWAVLRLIDQLPNPAYVPDVMSTNLPPFTFAQRVQELWKQLSISLFTKIYMSPNEKAMYEKLFGPIVAKRGHPLPPYEELQYNASLMLGVSHVVLGQATPLPPSYISVAGYHIEPRIQPLPEDLKSLMDSSEDGVVYFSMGSNLKSQDFPNEVIRDLLNVFSNLKQTVIWKFEKSLKNIPKNVHILEWAPQHSILSHRNCVLFVTHGGLLSTTEAVHFGVPLVGIPVYGDQSNNVDRAVQRGFARRVDLSYHMAEDLNAAITEVLTNQKYAEKAKELSSIYHNRLVPPRHELVHWVEYVVKTRGAPHLRSLALSVPWYQKMFLDLFVLIIIIVILVVVTVIRIFNTCNTLRIKNKVN